MLRFLVKAKMFRSWCLTGFFLLSGSLSLIDSVSAVQKDSACHAGAEQTVHRLYQNDVISDFWDKSLQQQELLFEIGLYQDLLQVKAENDRINALGYALIDVDIFSGTQMGTSGIHLLQCQMEDQDQIKVQLSVLVGSGHRQEQLPVTVFLQRDQQRWRITDIASYEDASVEGGYFYRLTDILEDWLIYADTEDSFRERPRSGMKKNPE